MEKDKQICSVCGTVVYEDEMHEFDGKVFCEDCLDEHTATCDNCGERIWNDDIISSIVHVFAEENTEILSDLY